MMDCIVCGVTNARRASSALDKPALNSSPAEYRVLWGRQSDVSKFSVETAPSACCARFNAYPSER